MLALRGLQAIPTASMHDPNVNGRASGTHASGFRHDGCRATEAPSAGLVRGYVGLDGEILSGSGFSVEVLKSGRRRIVFRQALTRPAEFPVVVVTPRNFLGGRNAAAVISLGSGEFEVEIYDAHSGEIAEDGFCFVAIGQEP